LLRRLYKNVCITVAVSTTTPSGTTTILTETTPSVTASTPTPSVPTPSATTTPSGSTPTPSGTTTPSAPTTTSITGKSKSISLCRRIGCGLVNSHSIYFAFRAIQRQDVLNDSIKPDNRNKKSLMIRTGVPKDMY
jgi:hypothetical protein